MITGIHECSANMNQRGWWS